MRAAIDPAALSRAVGRIWDEGRGNVLGWTVRTALGAFESDDRTIWQTADGTYSAEQRTSRYGRHVYLALFQRGTYLGRYDVEGWRAVSDRSRVRQLRSRQLPLRLAAQMAKADPQRPFVHLDVQTAYSAGGSSPSLPDDYVRALARQHPLNADTKQPERL